MIGSIETMVRISVSFLKIRIVSVTRIDGISGHRSQVSGRANLRAFRIGVAYWSVLREGLRHLTVAGLRVYVL